MTYRVRIDKIVSDVGYNMVAAEGKIVGGTQQKSTSSTPASPDRLNHLKNGQRVTFVGHARIMLPAMYDMEAGKLPVCQVEEWQIR